MIAERTPDGCEIRLRPRGPGRFVDAVFLTVWLLGWLLGEALAIWLLVRGAIALLTGEPPTSGPGPLPAGVTGTAAAFVFLWLSLWTLGGIAAIGALLGSLWGEDQIRVSGGTLTLTRARGPFRTSQTFERESIRQVLTLGTQDLLMLDNGTRRVELSRFGTREERTEIARMLQRELALPETTEMGRTLPDEWKTIATPAGELVLVTNPSTRRKQAWAVSIATAVGAAITVLLAGDGVGQPGLAMPAVIALVCTIALAAGAVWLAKGRKEWRVEPGRLTLRKRYGAKARDVFTARRLVLQSVWDSDGDVWYEVLGLGEGGDAAVVRFDWLPRRPKNSRTIARILSDRPAALDLVAWLSREASLVLEDRTTPEAREAELAKLRAALEGSGPFGRWAARWMDRLS